MNDLLDNNNISRPDKLIIGREVVDNMAEEVNSSARTMCICFILMLIITTVGVTYPILMGCTLVVMVLSLFYFVYKGIQFQNAESDLMSLEMDCFDDLDLHYKRWVNRQDDYLMATADALTCQEAHLHGDCLLCGAD